jgi:hypothetical protein
VAKIYPRALGSLSVAPCGLQGYGAGILSRLHTGSSFAKVKVTLRQTVSRPVRLGVRRPSGIRDQFFFLLEILFRQLRVRYFVAPSLTRGRVCNLPLLLVLVRATPPGSALSDERSLQFCLWFCMGAKLGM